jgi:predicted permease
MVQMFKDIEIGIRSLVKGRSFTLIAIVVLSLAIGANTAIFSMVDAILYRPFPFKDLSRLVAVYDTIPKVSPQRYRVSPANYLDWQRENHVFEKMVAFKPAELSLTSADGPERVIGSIVSPDFFSVLGMKAETGRTFSEHGAQVDPNQIVVSYGFWRERLAADPNVVGRRVTLDGLGYTVIGVMPEEFDYPLSTQVWTPWIVSPEDKNQRSRQEFGIVARMKSGVKLAQAQAEMAILGKQLESRYPAVNKGHNIQLVAIRETADPYAPKFITIVMGAAAFLLLLACANVANLQLARGMARKKEMAIRVAMGASPTQLARLLLTEGVLLASIGAALGFPFAVWALSVIRAAIPPTVAEVIPSVMHSTVDSRMLFFTIGVAIITGISFSLPAALQFSPARLQESLRDAGKGAAPSGRRRIGEVLVISEIAFAVILLIGAGLMLRGFQNLANIKQGFTANEVVTFDVGMSPSKYPEDSQIVNFYKETLRRLSAVPGVKAAGLTSDLPALGESRSSPILIEGQAGSPSDRPWFTEVRVVSQDYFRSLEIPVREGRSFSDGDDPRNMPVAIVSRSAAERFWPDHNVIGQRLKLTSAALNTSWLTVVGVVGDVNYFFLDKEVRPTVYVPYLQRPRRALHFLVLSNVQSESTSSGIRAAVLATDSTQRVYGLKTVNSFYSDLTGGVGVVAGLMETFALLALILSAVGIFALMAYSVAQRTHDIGIRMALGAQRWDIGYLVLSNALKLIVVGLLLGIPGAVALSFVMSSVLPALVILEPLTFVAFVLLLASVALIACYLPLRRATKVEPMIALHYS